MARKPRPRDYSPLPWVDAKICPHPVPVALLKFSDSDETRFYCGACGKTMTASDLNRDKR